MSKLTIEDLNTLTRQVEEIEKTGGDAFALNLWADRILSPPASTRSAPAAERITSKPAGTPNLSQSRTIPVHCTSTRA